MSPSLSISLHLSLSLSHTHFSRTQDRRENLWGLRTCAAGQGAECTIRGSYTPDPPLAGNNVATSPFVVYSERNNNVTFTADKCTRATGANINHCVPLLLALHLGGDDHTASIIFQQLLSTWDGVGFGPPKVAQKAPKQPLPSQTSTPTGRCQTRVDALYTTRSFGYFLLAQRALAGRPGFAVAPAVVAAMEARLWGLQGCDPDGGGMPASYNTAGEPCCEGGGHNGGSGHNAGSVHIENSAVLTGGLSSIETGALSLLPYDPRVRASWFPGR
jgi:hypothetical protein